MRSMFYTLMLTAAVLAGCGQDATHGTLTGTVTLDGQPLKEGLIRFIPKDGNTATADAPISGGAFTAQVPVGEKQISISAPKLVGQRKAYDTPDSPTVDIVEEAIPARYNVTTELMIDVKPGNQPAKFDLQSSK